MVTPHTNLVILHICCKLMNSLFSNIQSVHSMDYNLIAYDAFTGLATNYVSVNWVTNGAGNDLWPIRCQALTWPNADLLSIGCLETNAGQFWIKKYKAFDSSFPSDAYMCQWIGSSSVQVLACRLFGTKPLPEPMLAYCQLESWEQISMK